MSEKKYINSKCDECGGAMCPYVYKGRNNNYLCGGTWYNKGCGQNICFICGKREEEKFRWEEYGKDCCGNKETVKVCTLMFSQFERDENNPDRKLNVLYCEEHKEEALKSPLKWTEEDTKKEMQREEEEKTQEEQEREEKLNNQKKLFFLDGRADSKNGSKTVRDYGAFLGRQNGQNYYLMIPFNHPIWDKEETDPVIKKTVENFWWDGNQEDFFIIEGVENIPIEKASSNYWNQLSRGDKPIFHKIVGLNDKITITLGDISNYIKRLQRQKADCEKSLENIQVGKWNSDMDKEIPYLKKTISKCEEKIQWLSKNGKNFPSLSENKDNTPSSQSQGQVMSDKEIVQYFQKNDIKSIRLESNNLIIKYNNKQEKETKEINNQELKQIKSFAERIGKSELFLSDLESSSNTNAPNNNKSNKGLYIGLAVVGVLVVGIVAWLLMKNKKKK